MLNKEMLSDAARCGRCDECSLKDVGSTTHDCMYNAAQTALALMAENESLRETISILLEDVEKLKDELSLWQRGHGGDKNVI